MGAAALRFYLVGPRLIFLGPMGLFNAKKIQKF
jgi:hypothetical protein